MKALVIQLLQSAVAELQNTGVLSADTDIAVHVERARDKSHGDFASNIAMLLAKPARKNPRELATALIAHLPVHAAIIKVELAGPGFINFFLKSGSQQAVLRDVLMAGANYGRSTIGAGRKVQIEFVSANPTGPLHVGHGRGAAYGATCANLLEAVGYDVQREYYVNDAGRQMDILATSVWLRYLECCGESFAFPSNGYRGEYIGDYARELYAREARLLHRVLDDVLVGIPPDEPLGGDKDTHIDGLIARAKQLLGADYALVFNAGLQGILADIRTDLAEFGVQYDCWFSEQSLSVPHDLVGRAIERLQAAGFIEDRDGALWFMSTRFGDDKDRVVRRENGATTYFASDIAYHLHKFERGYDEVINIWGSDHHGYIVRVKAALQALGIDPARLVIRLVQFVSLYRGGEPVQMSTRSGSFIPLRELRNEVGCDAARFFYVMRKAEQPMDFDLDLAKSQSKDNPVYYLQYAHARVCSMERKATSQGVVWSLAEGLENLDLLIEESEGALALALARFPEVVQDAATEGEPHQVVNYLRDLAGEFHGWYNSHRILLDDSRMCSARMVLSFAVRHVLANGLALLGVSAPQEM